ncbi:MAG: hypothetical protein IPF54_14500 [Draconibacterium sp.]|nr:hypothetical protein [Draconibacterium sp.]
MGRTRANVCKWRYLQRIDSYSEGYYTTYKFKNGDNWETVLGNCTIGENADRFISLETENLILDAVCFGSCVDCTLEQILIEQDSLTLVAFYNATNGDEWQNNENWLTGPIQTWWGVGIEHGRVVGLDMGWNNNLVGNIPNEIGNLSALRELNIRNEDNLTGNIPTTIGNLTTLHTLRFYNCALTGTIPNEILNLYNLKVLELSWNNFDPASMPNFGNLNQLKTLIAEACNFTGPLPGNLSFLQNLEILYLSENPDLDQSPIPDFSNAQRLTRFGLANCNLTGTIPQWITQLPVLERVLLANNNLTGTIPQILLTRKTSEN